MEKKYRGIDILYEEVKDFGEAFLANFYAFMRVGFAEICEKFCEIVYQFASVPPSVKKENWKKYVISSWIQQKSISEDQGMSDKTLDISNENFKRTAEKLGYFDRNLFSFSKLSKDFKVRILYKDLANLGKLKQYERIACPFTVYVLKIRQEFIFLIPIVDNAEWGFQSGGKEFRGKKEELLMHHIRDFSENVGKCRSCNGNSQVSCSNFHKYCFRCLVGNMNCQVCKKYDSKFVKSYLLVKSEEIKANNFKAILENETKDVEDSWKITGTCKRCEKYEVTENYWCYFCNLFEKIIGKNIRKP